MSGCPSCIGTACPDPVSEVTVNTYSVSGAAALTVAVTTNGSVNTIVVTAASAGYWLLDCTIFDTSTPADTAQTLQPPPTPGVNQFRKITNSAGVCTFTIDKESLTGLTWYLGVINLGQFGTLATV
jgi:TusA-related sulfurtransferase